MTDLINHPPHYTSHPSGVECIQITEHMRFNLGIAGLDHPGHPSVPAEIEAS